MKKLIIIMLLMVIALSSTVLASVGTKEAILNYMRININIDDVCVVPRDANGEGRAFYNRRHNLFTS